MATDLSANIAPMAGQEPTLLNEQLYCALTGKPIAADEAYWAPPLITARTLVGTILQTAIHAPSDLGRVLFEEQANVPYAQSAREQLAARRSSEQLKLLLGLLLVVALVAVPILLVAMR
jgi:hypothetical protein